MYITALNATAHQTGTDDSPEVVGGKGRSLARMAKADFNDQGSVAMAVVVQAMVSSQVSGILFTANPATGERSEGRVGDATRGGGDGQSLVVPVVSAALQR